MKPFAQAWLLPIIAVVAIVGCASHTDEPPPRWTNEGCGHGEICHGAHHHHRPRIHGPRDDGR